MRCIRTKDVDLDVEVPYLTLPSPKGGKPFDLPLADYTARVIRKALPKAKHGYLWPAQMKGSQGPICSLLPKQGEFSFPWVIHDLRRLV